MGMNELSESIHNDREIFSKAVRRAKVNGVEEFDRYGVIVFLEKEIDMYRDKIEKLFDEKEKLKTRLNAIDGTSHFNAVVEKESVQDSTISEIIKSEIIKALAENGYSTITIDYYKTESEE